MTKIVWGDEIAITNNEKPDWLSNDDVMLPKWGGCDLWSELECGSKWKFLSHMPVSAIKLPHDHPYYTKNDGFGPEIKVDGKPDWLGLDELAHVQWYGDFWYPNGPIEVKHAIHTPLTAIRLHSDHFAYTAINAGFEPWGGGKVWVGTWYGGNVVTDALIQNGNIIGIRRNNTNQETKETNMEESFYNPGDWIVRDEDALGITEGKAYRVNEDQHFLDDEGDGREAHRCLYRLVDTVTIPVMIDDEWRSVTYDGYFCWAKSVGIIREKPQIEKFEDYHGGLDDNQRAIITIYQDWLTK